MLNKKEIDEIAKAFGRKNWQQEKHYIQNIALIELAEYPLVFKGGTYLWLFHNLNRFSEDLDFTTNGKINPEELMKKIQQTINYYGIENKVKKIQQNENSLSFRIKAKGPLLENDQSDCYVYIEISKREKILDKTISLELKNPYNLPIKIINGMNLNEVASEKVRAILTRNKARDLFDLNFLIKKGIKFDKTKIEKKLEHYNKSFEKKEFEKKVKKYKKDYKKELNQLIFGEIEDFDIVQKNVLGWIK